MNFEILALLTAAFVCLGIIFWRAWPSATGPSPYQGADELRIINRSSGYYTSPIVSEYTLPPSEVSSGYPYNDYLAAAIVVDEPDGSPVEALNQQQIFAFGGGDTDGGGATSDWDCQDTSSTDDTSCQQDN
jgi:hypothetical protein